MPTRTPNSTNLNNFVAKVFDKKARKYVPIYQAPDATSSVQGDVLLSDAINSTSNAATGMTAATPNAVKVVNDNANTKLSKTDTGTQTVASPVTFNSDITVNNGITIPSGSSIKGNLNGNASTATKLQTSRTIYVKSNTRTAGSANFDGSANVTITIPEIDATTVKGVLSLDNIPVGAQERLVTKASAAERLKLTISDVQNGDTVYQSDTKTMYMVIDQTKLNSEDGYREYQAGTAARLGASTIGANGNLWYLNSGTPTNFSDSIGNSTTPVYVNAGAITALNYTIAKSVPSDAKFTDTTYTKMTGASADADGKEGLVPQPKKGEQNLFLRGDGTWQVAGKVTGVKGNYESTYRTGDVNITPANIGALDLTGGTLTGTLNTQIINSQSIVPIANNQYDLGNNSYKWSSVYATTFNGALSGNATTATTASKLNNTIAITGDVTVAATTLNTTTAISLASTIGNSKVTTAKIADSNVTTAKIADANITSDKLANKAVTNGKLADDVGTVYVGSTEPTEAHVKIWVKI